MPRSEKTQRGNPYQLTRKQHVFPARSIERFLDGDGVELFDRTRGIRRRARTDDPIFCADRAWNHGAEHGFMKEMEDAFQQLVESEPLDIDREFDDAETMVINDFYGLWLSRAQRRHLPYQRIMPEGDVLGTRVEYSPDDLEKLEKNNIIGADPDGSFALRDMMALVIRLDIDRTREEICNQKWGVVTTADGEFCVPDVPSHGLIPIGPTIALALDNPGMILARHEVELANLALCAGMRDYLFARALSVCPGLPS